MEDKIEVELMIDEANRRVVFLECDGNFVDVLLSFLVMPIGAVVRLTEKSSGLGCMDALYESVAKLNVNLFQTPACKDMLLHPNYAHDTNCRNLIINIDPLPQENYMCPKCKQGTEGRCYRQYSTVKNAICKCGELMNWSIVSNFSKEKAVREVGVFVKGKEDKYMVSDDLHIYPPSTKLVLNLLKKFQVSDCNQLHQKRIHVVKDKVLYLLKRFMVSTTALTDTFLFSSHNYMGCPAQLRYDPISILSRKSDAEKKMSMTLFLNKLTKQVLYAEAKEDVVDLFFSILTFPLGLLPNLHQNILPSGCINNLHSSASDLSEQKKLRTPRHSSCLLQPQLEPHHRCNNQILQVKEGKHETTINKSDQVYIPINPKLSTVTTEVGGGFVKGPKMFIITDDLRIKVSEASTSVSILRDKNVQIENVEERVVNVGEEQALMMLRASLLSKSALSVLSDD